MKHATLSPPTPPAPKCYEEIKALAAGRNRTLASLLALTHTNDPFAADLPSRRTAARWFMTLWRQLRLTRGHHLRRIHYLLVSQSQPVRKPDGRPYENTVADSDYLIKAAQAARYLDMIAPGAFVDRRNPEPTIYLTATHDSPATIFAASGSVDGSSFGDIDGTLSLSWPQLMLEPPHVGQHYHVEMWCEKSTINDILMPLGRMYGINIVTAVGEMSLTRCEGLIERALESERPVRILYLSDFDPGGQSMPVAAARKIEFLLLKHRDLDVQLRIIGLTHEQCIRYRLPRTPIKETERRAAKFEARFGEGGTELDALEALHPGVLERILIGEINRYRDGTLDQRVRAVAAQLQDDLRRVNEAVHARHAKQIAKLEAQREKIETEIRGMYERIVEREHDLEQRARPVMDAIKSELRNEALDLDQYDWPEPNEGDEDDDPLFDYKRNYLDQIARYRTQQGKPTEQLRFSGWEKTCLTCGKGFIAGHPRGKFCSGRCRDKARPPRNRGNGTPGCRCVDKSERT
jgi:hypothetical protein